MSTGSLYVLGYKTLYLLAVLSNLALLATATTAEVGNVSPEKADAYYVGGTVLALNVLGGIGLFLRVRGALFLERALSASRMVALVGASSVVAAGLLVYSPVFLVFWKHVFELAQDSLAVLWGTTAVLMAGEVIYFRKLAGVVASVQ